MCRSYNKYAPYLFLLHQEAWVPDPKMPSLLSCWTVSASAGSSEAWLFLVSRSISNNVSQMQRYHNAKSRTLVKLRLGNSTHLSSSSLLISRNGKLQVAYLKLLISPFSEHVEVQTPHTAGEIIGETCICNGERRLSKFKACMGGSTCMHMSPRSCNAAFIKILVCLYDVLCRLCRWIRLANRGRLPASFDCTPTTVWMPKLLGFRQTDQRFLGPSKHERGGKDLLE